MKKRSATVIASLLSVFILLIWVLPAIASDQSDEIQQLKNEVQKLLKRIDELEKRQTKTEAKTAEVEKKPAEEKKTLQSGYDNGFYIKSADENYSLKTNVAIQFRYTYLDFDKKVNSNNEDWNNFLMRRARVWFQGNAPNKDWTYLFHIQLEPQSAVNLNDAYVTWKKYPYAQVQAGRSKIPYGLEMWASATQLNGIERTIFSGETDVDGKSDSRKWPGSNANFPVSDEDSVTKFPIGGLNLFRSQGITLQGDVDLFGQNGFFQYWTGVYNGRNTKGSVNIDSSFLYAGRISINPYGKSNLVQQGDIDYSKDPKLCFLISLMQYTDRLTQIKSATSGSTQTVGAYDISGSGYNIAGLFRYRGFSFDTEYGIEWFQQKRQGGNIWERFGYRFNAGYFLVPKKLELIARYAYVERLKNNTVADSYASGLGLVSANGGTNNAIENNLQEYTTGLNYYITGHRLKLFVDYSYLIRELTPVGTASVGDQHDNRFRTMIQYFF